LHNASACTSQLIIIVVVARGRVALAAQLERAVIDAHNLP
jgi:hypothetical protein